MTGPDGTRTRRVLVDGAKVATRDHDGIERYARELLVHLLPTARDPTSGWRVDVHLGLWLMFDLGSLESLVRTGRPDASTPRAARLVVWLRRTHDRLWRRLAEIIPVWMVSILYPVDRVFHRVVMAVTRPLDFDDYDVVHLLLPQSWGLVKRSAVRTLVTTVHDLTHATLPHFHTATNVANAEAGFDHLVARGSRFVAVSDATRRELLEHHPIVSPADVVTVHEACDRSRFAPVSDPGTLAAVRRRYGIPDAPYLVSLGTLEPRKNLVNTVKAFLLLLAEDPDLDVSLAVAGRRGWRIEELLDDPTLRSDRVVLTGYVEEDDLAALYSGARALSFVSHHEGFGLPALEAMSCGTPVVYANRGALPEVVGGGGVPADPSSIESIRDAFGRMLRDDGLRESLSAAARARASAFSWERAAAETLAAYERFLAEAGEVGDATRGPGGVSRAPSQTG